MKLSSFKLKVILLGAPAVGKTSLIQRFVKQFFHPDYALTTGVDILTKDVEFRQGEIASLSIWDIGGQQRFDFIRDTFYQGAAGVLIVFDLTRKLSFESTRQLLIDVRQATYQDIPILLIGNKKDLIEDMGRVINPRETLAYVMRETFIYIETSAKTGENVEEAFTEITRRIIDMSSEGILDYQPQSFLQDKIWMDMLIDFKDHVKFRVKEILSSPKEDDFRFLIVGNEELQKPLLSILFSVEGIVWPPRAFSILYNSLSYQITIHSDQYKFEIFLLSNIKKLNENQEIFLKACDKSEGIIVFYDPGDLKDFTNATNFCISLRKQLPDLEIILTTGSKYIPGRFKELEKLEKNYQINSHDEHESLLTEMLINVLNRQNETKEEKGFLIEKLEKFKDQLTRQESNLNKIKIDMRETLFEYLESGVDERKYANYDNKRDYEDDFALSFAGEDREIAKRIAEALKEKDVKIFYDEFFESDLLGRKLSTYFQEKYGRKTRFVIVIISKYYALKDWTNLELKIAREEAKVRKDDLIIPIRLDDTVIYGIHDDVGFINYREKDLDGTVKMLLEKLKSAKLRELIE